MLLNKIKTNKKARVFTAPRDTISFFVGVVLAAFGVLPLLSKWGIVKFQIPFLSNIAVSVLVWIVAVAGLYVLIDGFIEPPAHALHWMLILIGLILAIVGLIPILKSFGVLGFTLPFNDVVYRIIITLEGLLLIIGGLTEH